MKVLILLITILLVSCSLPETRSSKPKQVYKKKKIVKKKRQRVIPIFIRMERCATRFANLGFKSDAIIKLCKEVYKSRD